MFEERFYREGQREGYRETCIEREATRCVIKVGKGHFAEMAFERATLEDRWPLERDRLIAMLQDVFRAGAEAARGYAPSARCVERDAMTVFYVDDAVIADLETLRKTAEANPYSEALMRAFVASGNFVIPDTQRLTLPTGFKVMMTIEYQPFGMARHISISSPRPKHFPLPQAVNMILPHLGFRHDLERCLVYPEDLPDGGAAINVLEPLDGRSMAEIEAEGQSRH